MNLRRLAIVAALGVGGLVGIGAGPAGAQGYGPGGYYPPPRYRSYPIYPGGGWDARTNPRNWGDWGERGERFEHGERGERFEHGGWGRRGDDERFEHRGHGGYGWDRR